MRGNRQRQDGFLFDPAKSIESTSRDNLLQLLARAGLHQDVGVKESKPEALCEQNSDGAFPHAGHADQYDIITGTYFRFHGCRIHRIGINGKSKPMTTPGSSPDKPLVRQCLLGAHLSIAGGLENALYSAAQLDCSVLQIFTKNASTWKERTLKAAEIERFDAARAETGMRMVAAHTSYLINIASPDRKQRLRSCAALEKELQRSSALQISDVVLHPGSHMGSGTSRGLGHAAGSLNAVLSKRPRTTARLLLETTAGQGSSLGYRFEQIAALIERIEDKSKIGVCLDTAHIFAAGYDIRTAVSFSEVMRQFETTVGSKYLKLLHLNDSKKDLGMRVDRHQHIGEGFIGTEAFRLIMRDSRLAAIPKIIETPKDARGQKWDQINLDRLRRMLAQ